MMRMGGWPGLFRGRLTVSHPQSRDHMRLAVFASSAANGLNLNNTCKQFVRIVDQNEPLQLQRLDRLSYSNIMALLVCTTSHAQICFTFALLTRILLLRELPSNCCLATRVWVTWLLESKNSQKSVDDALSREALWPRTRCFLRSDILNMPVSCVLTKPNPVASVRKRTTPTKRPPLVGEISANFYG
jgi:hypothetical protein